jgi:hypothetical protein
MNLNNMQDAHQEKLCNLSTEVAVIKSEFKHLINVINSILDSVKKTEILILKIDTLEKKVYELEELIHQKTDFKGKLNKFAFSTRHWIILITFIAMILGYVVEILYKLNFK